MPVGRTTSQGCAYGSAYDRVFGVVSLRISAGSRKRTIIDIGSVSWTKPLYSCAVISRGGTYSKFRQSLRWVWSANAPPITTTTAMPAMINSGQLSPRYDLGLVMALDSVRHGMLIVVATDTRRVRRRALHTSSQLLVQPRPRSSPQCEPCGERRLASPTARWSWR